MANQLKLFKIRDLRKKEKFFIDDDYLNGWARIVKPVGTAAYMSLCRHADKDQKAWPSQELIADEHGINTRTIKRGIKKLRDYNIIQVEQERKRGKFTNYIYYLIDRSQWKRPPGDKKCLRSHQGTKTDVSKTTSGKLPTKDTHLQGTNLSKDKLEKQVFPRSDYIKIHEAYEKYKGIIPRGKEWDPIDRDIKLMFRSERTPEQIISFMDWFAWAVEASVGGVRKYEWVRGWTIKTVRMKIAEFVAGKFKEKTGKEVLEELYPDKIKIK